MAWDRSSVMGRTSTSAGAVDEARRSAGPDPEYEEETGQTNGNTDSGSCLSV